jgi:hypothetical protein
MSAADAEAELEETDSSSSSDDSDEELNLSSDEIRNLTRKRRHIWIAADPDADPEWGPHSMDSTDIIETFEIFWYYLRLLEIAVPDKRDDNIMYTPWPSENSRTVKIVHRLRIASSGSLDIQRETNQITG